MSDIVFKAIPNNIVLYSSVMSQKIIPTQSSLSLIVKLTHYQLIQGIF